MKRNGLRRFTAQSEIRAADDGKTLEGYAARFGVWTRILWWDEQVKRGAFTKTLGEQDIRALFNHDRNMVLGRNKAGTLELAEDKKGLLYSVVLPDSRRDVIESVARGDVTQSSFGFDVIKEETKRSEGDEPDKVTLVEVRLYDVSPVTFAAYEQTEGLVVRAQMDQACRELDLDSQVVDILMRSRYGQVLHEGELESISDYFSVAITQPEEPPEEGHSEEIDTEPDDSATRMYSELVRAQIQNTRSKIHA